MRYRLFGAFVLSFVVDMHQASPRTNLFRALVGQWEGTLQYRDYSNPNRRVTLPTTLTVRWATDSSSLALHFKYDDGPGKIVENHDVFAADPQAKHISWGGIKDSTSTNFVVTRQRYVKATDSLNVVLEGEGKDDNAPATIRQTLIATRSALRILKETRPAGGTFGFRHEYILVKR